MTGKSIDCGSVARRVCEVIDRIDREGGPGWGSMCEAAIEEIRDIVGDDPAAYDMESGSVGPEEARRRIEESTGTRFRGWTKPDHAGMCHPIWEPVQDMECRSIARGLTREQARTLCEYLEGFCPEPQHEAAFDALERIANAKATEQESVSLDLDPLRSIVSELQDFYDSHAPKPTRILRQAAKLENWIDAARLMEEKSVNEKEGDG